MHRRRAQGAAADAQHHKGVEVLADPLGHLLDLFHDFALVIGQLGPAQPVLAPAGLHRLIGRRRKGRIFLHLGAGDTILEAQSIGHHMVYVQGDGLFHHVSHCSFILSIP